MEIRATQLFIAPSQTQIFWDFSLTEHSAAIEFGIQVVLFPKFNTAASGLPEFIS